MSANEKDVIYIDIEDDITSIISKVKSADAKIVALVPPKRVGVLQSVVNLKLLQRAAEQAGKRVVLITNDHSLQALAAGVRMPVAKNLQSKPEIAPIAALEVDEDEVINGAELPVGDIAETVGAGAVATAAAADQTAKPATPATPASRAAVPPKPAAKPKSKGPRIPNFESFRNKLFLFGGLGLALIIFFIWATVFAPHATITISAKTSPVDINKTLALNPSLQQSDPTKLAFKANVQQLKKSVSVEFDTTGTKDIGQKAAGTITIRNCDYSDGFTLSSGARFTAASGQVFVSTQQVSVPKFTGLASLCSLSGSSAGKATVAVQAFDIGSDYNIAAQSYSISGFEGQKVDANGTAMSGGSKENVQVVAQADVDKAKQQLTQQDSKAVKSELDKQFTSDYLLVTDSFTVTPGEPAVSPAVGEQAKKAKLTLETVYTEVGVAKTDVKTLLDSELKTQVKDNQSMYANGETNARFIEFAPVAAGFTAKLTATGYVGPKINTTDLAKQLKGKRYGEVQQTVQAIPGVEKVETVFSPFWVNTIPSADKVDIKFSVLNDTKQQ